MSKESKCISCGKQVRHCRCKIFPEPPTPPETRKEKVGSKLFCILLPIELLLFYGVIGYLRIKGFL